MADRVLSELEKGKLMDEDRISVKMLKTEAERLSDALGFPVELEALLYVILVRWLSSQCDMDESDVARSLITQLYTGECPICRGRWGIAEEPARHDSKCPYAEYHDGLSESEYFAKLLRPKQRAA